MSGVRQDGLVSVVIAAYDVADYLPEALDSVLAQDGVDLEVVVVDDGSTDATGQVADTYAARDARVVVIHQPNGGLGAARNAGIERARGELLTFCDADDVLPPGALRTLAGSLRDSGADLAVGRIHRLLPDGTHSEPVWVTESHAAAPLRGVTVEQHPLVVKDIVACNRMYRRASWDERIGTFPVGVAYEDHVPMLVSYLADSRIDVLDEVTYLWRTRPDLSSISQRKAEDTNFADRLTVMALAWEAVQAEAPAVRSMWLARALELDLAGYYHHVATSSPTFRARLRDAAALYLGLADDDALRFVSVHRKVSAWLAAEERWDVLAELEGNATQLRRHGTLVAGWPTADPEVLHRLDIAVPPRLLALSAFDTRARAALREVRLADDAVEVELDAWLRGVKRPESLDAVWLGLSLPGRSPLRIDAAPPGRGASARIDAAGLRTWAAGATGRVAVTVHYRWGEASGEVPLRPATDRLPLARPARTPGVSTELDDDGALVIVLEPPPLPTRSLSVGRRGAVAVLEPRDGAPDRLALPVPPEAEHEGLPRVDVDGQGLSLAWPAGETTGVVLPRGLAARRVGWRWERTVRGEATLAPRGPLLELIEVAPAGGALELTLRVSDPWQLDLGALQWSVGTARPGRDVVTLRLTADDLRALGTRTRLTAATPGQPEPVTVRWARNLLATVPLDLELDHRTVRLRASRDGEVALVARTAGQKEKRDRR